MRTRDKPKQEIINRYGLAVEEQFKRFALHKLESDKSEKRLHLVAPLFIRLAKYKKDGKKYWLNLNNFNYWKGKGYNQIKSTFIEELAQVNAAISQTKMSYIGSIDVQMIFGDMIKRDRDNYAAAIRKFVMDALVVKGCISDDNEKYIGIYSDHPSLYIKGVYEAHITISYI